MYDVIIVGSGIAGNAIAQSLGGLNVLILEKNKNVVPKDSGIVSKRFFDYYSTDFIKNEISDMELVSPNGSSFHLHDEKTFAYILKREKFSRYMVKKSWEKSEFRYETLVSLNISKEKATAITNNGSYDAKIVVGCDGASSGVRKSVGIAPPKLSLGVMVKESGLKNNGIKVFFNKEYSPDFFSWIIPQSDEYGLMAGRKGLECLEKFKSDLRLKKGRIYAHMVPTGMTRSYSERCILVGDSCGQSKPLTGGGIIFSLVASRHASDIIKTCLDKDRFDIKMLSRYEKLWKSDIASEIKKQLLVRKAYSGMKNNDIDKIFREFGHHMQNLRGFDYDKFSSSWRHLPKMKMVKFAISRIPYLF